MSRHVFDPVSAVLGVIVVVAGLLVGIGQAVDLDVNLAWLITAAAILIGLALIPWPRSVSPQLGGQQASPEEAVDADSGGQ